MSGPGSPISRGGALARLVGMEAAPDEEGAAGPDITGASALSYGCSHGKWQMTNGRWHMADGRRISKLLSSVICHLPSAICHASPKKNDVSPPVPCRPAPASRSAPVQGP